MAATSSSFLVSKGSRMASDLADEIRRRIRKEVFAQTDSFGRVPIKVSAGVAEGADGVPAISALAEGGGDCPCCCKKEGSKPYRADIEADCSDPKTVEDLYNDSRKGIERMFPRWYEGIFCLDC